MAGRIANVWGVACSRCHAPVDSPCWDLSATKLGRTLFGRRTHKERRHELRRQKKDGRETKLMEHVRRHRTKYQHPIGVNNATGGFVYAPSNIRFEGQPWTPDDLITEWRTIQTATTSANLTLTANGYTTGGTITVTRDQIWNGWTVGNTTTGTYTTIADEDLVRFEGNGITFDWTQPVYSVSRMQDVVYDRWRVIHEREVPSAEELQRIADEVQRQREEASRARLEREQARQRANEDRILAQVRGLELLMMVLTDEQREQYDRNATIPVRGSLGGLYEIDTLQNGVHGNIIQVDEHGCRLGRICVAPRMHVDGFALPLADGWVGQLLAIQTDEKTFRERGNWSGRRACAHPDVPILERAA